MKITLAFGIYNKEQWIASLLHSWLGNLSGQHEAEAIIVFDASVDNSPELARGVLSHYGISHTFLYADDVYEIKCNNIALQHAAGDVIVFIQDDNWMYDQGYDDTLAQVMERIEHIGAVGLLAGLEFQAGFRWRRVEVDRPHKGAHFHGAEGQPLAVYAVDGINRPFAVNIPLLMSLGGLDEAYCPTSYDDLDLSIELLKRDYVNVYVPFDVVNVCGSRATMGEVAIGQHYGRGHSLCKQRHQAYTDRMETNVQILYPLVESGGGLALCST